VVGVGIRVKTEEVARGRNSVAENGKIGSETMYGHQSVPITHFFDIGR
jgi:hypothetical protein